jgi:hypothetical protein
MKIFWGTFTKKATPIKNSFPTGMVLFVGHQGAGKTISAVHYLQYLQQKYPDIIIFSNIKLSLPNSTVLKPEEISDYLLKDFGRQPVAFLLDEIQTLLRAKSSGSSRVLSEETLMSIQQQRKANKTILGTLQEFLDLDITYRRQLLAQVQCRHMGKYQYEFWKLPSSLKYDPEKNDYTGKNMDVWIWKRHDDVYNLYDTFELVKQSINTASRISSATLPANSG